MKVSYVKSLVRFGLYGLLALSCNIANAKLADSLEVSNQTELNLGTSAAGWAGNGIPANSSSSINTTRVSMGCFLGAAMSNCPIEFTDTATGAKVATVYLDVYSGILNQPPTFHGEYVDKYEVIGWQGNPLQYISIVKLTSENGSSIS